MAQRRMFSLKVIDTDAFLDMPQGSQLLYFHLAMRADDDGFVSSPKKIMRIIGCRDDDMRVLQAKQFIIPFESGICVIKHWRIHNYIQKDRYSPSLYKSEKSMLESGNGEYEISIDTKCIQNESNVDTQVRLGKVRLGKVRVDVVEDGQQQQDIKKIISVYENNVGMLSSIITEKLLDYLNDLPSDVIIAAIEEATLNNKRNFKYMQAILNSWISQGVKCMQDVRNLKDEFNSKKNKPSNANEKQSKFINYDQRTYDFDQLEKRAMENLINENMEGE